MPEVTRARSHIPGRQVRAINITPDEIRRAGMNGLGLENIGFHIPQIHLRAMIRAHGFDSVDVNPPSTMTPGTAMTPIQFLQEFLPGAVRVVTTARKADILMGITTAGSWEMESIVQQVLEEVGAAVPYTDYGDIPLASFNPGYEQREIVRFESGLQVGALEEARAARAKINSSTEKRQAAMLALEISRNRVALFGYNNGNNRTYGFLNDPSLPAYYSVPLGAAGSTQWATKTFLEITADLRLGFSQLRAKSGDNIDPKTTAITLALPTDVVDYLTTTSDMGISVLDWLEKNYKNVRIESLPQLQDANGGVNVGYMYADSVDDSGTDNGDTFAQIVPAKFQTLGVEKRAKTYIEDYTNATAGALLKRPYAVFRFSGI